MLKEAASQVCGNSKMDAFLDQSVLPPGSSSWGILNVVFAIRHYRNPDDFWGYLPLRTY